MIRTKHLTIWLILSVSMILTGCSSDDDQISGLSDGNPEILVGKWYCMEIEIDEDGDVDIIKPNSENYYLQLNEDGSTVVRPRNLFENEKRGGEKWSVKGNKLFFSDKSEYTIKRVNDSDLVLEWLDYDGDDDYLKETHTFKRHLATVAED